MSTIASHRLRTLLATAAAATLFVGCSDDAPVAPRLRVAELGSCENLQAPAGSQLASHAYARGVQVYRWNGTGWAFVEPSAVLFADAGGRGAIGSHYAGPTWQSVSGSKVVAAVAERCTAAADAIPWLLLRAVSSEGPGVYEGTTFVQRVNTVGGLAPTAPGKAAGEVASVPYTAEYFFYRAR